MQLTIEQAEKTDRLLKELLDNGNMVYEQAVEFFKTADEMCVAVKVVEKMELVHLAGEPFNKLFLFLTPRDGLETFLNNGGLTKALTKRAIELEKQAEKEELEIRKSKVDLELAERTLKEFPRTKWFARFGFFIGVILGLKELIEWIMQLQSQ